MYSSEQVRSINGIYSARSEITSQIYPLTNMKFPYRLGDIVAFGSKSKPLCANSLELYPDSIGAEYLRRAKCAPKQYSTLAEIVRERLNEDKEADSKTVVIHLRAGDVVDRDSRSVDELMKRAHLALSSPPRKLPKQLYVRPGGYHELLAGYYRNRGVTKAMILTGYHKSSNPAKSREYVKKVKSIWESKGMKVQTLVNRPPDEDFLQMVSAVYFVPSGGGFSDKVMRCRRALRKDAKDIQYPCHKGHGGGSFLVQDLVQWDALENFLKSL